MTTTLSSQQPSKSNQLPCKPGNHFLLGDLNEFSINWLGYLQTIADQCGLLVEVRLLAPVDGVLVGCLPAVKELTQLCAVNARAATSIM